jgi:hypothetical protein
MMTRAAKSALAAANYVTRRHRRPASIIRQQARRKTEPWPSKQAQITSDLCPQLKDADRPLAAQITAGIRATGATGDCHDASPLVRHVSDLPAMRSWAH